MSRITPFGFVYLSVFLFFLFDCFASISTLVSTSLGAIHFFEVSGVKGGTGKALYWPGQESPESHQGNPAPVFPLPSYIGLVSAGLANKHFADLATVGGQEPAIFESAMTLMQSCSGQYTSTWSSVGSYACMRSHVLR